ncbi:MAG: glycosyltransferase family 4 protein [Lachnospiraceae bacterium]|nr:glycosyltransferase family 4 protein [Lachnospiraceae bacterium]
MKILITSDYYDPEVNGVVTSIKNLKSGLEKDGHEVRILTLAYNLREEKSGEVYYIGSFSVAMIYPNARIVIPKNYSLIKELIAWKPDVIHSQCEFSTFVYARQISAKTGAPIVHTYHTVYEGYTHYFCPSKILGRNMVSKFTRQVSKKANAFIVPTEKMYNMLEGYHVNTHMEVIPSGINLDRYEKDFRESRERIRRQYGISKNQCVLLFLGRLAKEKNVDELISFISKGNDPKLRLMIVGDGPCREKLKKKCKEVGMEDITVFTGMVKPEQVPEYYSAGDIFVNASTSETQGLTYMEAMASGLPILCRQDNCLDGVVENEINGFIYHDEKEFLNYLSVLSNSPIQRFAVGHNAKKTIQDRYSIESFTKSCENLYVKCGATG